MQRNNSTGLEADGPAEIKREHPNEVKFMRYSFPIALILPFATRFQKYHRQYKTIIFKCFKNNKFFSFNTNNKIYPEPENREGKQKGSIPAQPAPSAKNFYASHKPHDPTWEPSYLSL